jgi:transcriptional regulator with XRE-family HTH domain
MPPSLLPDREQQICARFRKVRQDHRFKQEEFADMLTISVARLKSYEYARAPIKYHLAKWICENMDVNQRWLATGELPATGAFEISPAFAMFIPDRLNFSFVYDRLLRGLLGEELKAVDTHLSGKTHVRPRDCIQLPVPADWRGMMMVISNIIQRAFLDFCEEGSVDRVRATVERIEKIIGPFGKKEWSQIDHGLKIRKYRKKTSDIADVQKEVLSKLGLTMEKYRKLNELGSIESAVEHIETIADQLDRKEKASTKKYQKQTSIGPGLGSR